VHELGELQRQLRDFNKVVREFEKFREHRDASAQGRAGSIDISVKGALLSPGFRNCSRFTHCSQGGETLLTTCEKPVGH
jgi:hypothetical protein